MAEKTAVYTGGHHESVLRSHRWRTAENSAGYLLSALRSDMKILDIGCGPGTITVDFARLVPEGEVIGVDYEPSVVDKARETASQSQVQNVRFLVGDITTALEFPDDSFDVVHAHQVLQHVADPVYALREMRRLTRPGGIIACRESDFSAMTFYPELEQLKEWQNLYVKLARHNGGEPNAGRRLVSWARRAGIEREKITASAGTWCYSSLEERNWWSAIWADRVVASSFGKMATSSGFAREEDLNRIADGWRRWGSEEDAWFAVLHGEILCRK